MTIHLRELRIDLNRAQKPGYPLNLPVITHLSAMKFASSVTIFVGENGSGKSTLLEAIAKSAGSINIGSDELDQDPSLQPVQPLVDKMKLTWNKRVHRGFFLRAEDFFGYIKRMCVLRKSMQEELNRIDDDYRNRSNAAKAYAKMPAVSSLLGMDQRYGHDLDAYSHGESFLTLFQSRFVPGGLYLLDEPEAALSPMHQLGLIAMIKSMLSEDSQFIIATHSPIIMEMPGAQLMDFDQAPPVESTYDELEHVRLFRLFMEDPQAFIEKL